MTKVSKRKKNFKKYWQLYLFLALPLVYLLVFKYYPMLGAQIAFKEFRPQYGIWGSEWVGFANFERFFSSYQFQRVITNTLVLSFYSLLASFPIPIILALMLNSLRNKRFKNVIETIAYIPHFISIVVLVGMMMQMLNPHIGILGAIYRLFGQSAPDLFGSPAAFPHLYVWSGIWQNTGWGTIIYLAALMNVDPQLYEAADLDGAGRLKKMWYITLPGLLPAISINMILSLSNIMYAGFDQIYNTYNTVVSGYGKTLELYLFELGVTGGDYPLSTAVGLFNSTVGCILVIIANKCTKLMGGEGIW